MGSRLSSSKGAEYERTICARLSLWVSELKREDVFWRSAMSGGRANLPSRRGRGHAYTAQSGDISAVHELGHHLLHLFVLECKFHKDVQLSPACYGRPSALVFRFWEQVTADAEASERNPMLVMKQNQQKDLVGVTQQGLVLLRSASEDPLVPLVVFPGVDLYLISMRAMLCHVNYSMMRRLYVF